MSPSAQGKQPNESNQPKKKLELIQGGVESIHAVPVPVLVVTQARLADIAELQARIAYDRNQLRLKWNQVRHDLLKGALLERGPLRAYFEGGFTMKRGKKFVRSRLIVR